MALYLLDLNDNELRIFRDGSVVAESVGYAFMSGTGVVFGDEARRQFRLHPRQANNQYWHRLAMDPLAVRGPNLSNMADLVYRHFGELAKKSAIGAADELYVVAPGTVTPDQLGLLLGVAQELGIVVTGLVDAAVASSTEEQIPSRVVHIDLSLHRATVTSLDAGNEISRSSFIEIPEAGLSHIVDGWVNVVSSRFVTETRFDPLRIAETEQQVYNQVHDWLASNDRRAELIIETSHRDALRRVTVPTTALTDKASARLRMLSEAVPVKETVLLSHRAARVPGLMERLSVDGATLKVLAPDALARGVTANSQRIRSNPAELRFITRLPRSMPAETVTEREEKRVAAAAPLPANPPRTTPRTIDTRLPSHVLYKGRARAIGTRLLVGHGIFADPARAASLPDRIAIVEVASDGVWVRAAEAVSVSMNGRTMTEAMRTRVGDVIRWGDHEFTLIQVIDGQES